MITKPRGTKDRYGQTYTNYQEMIALLIDLLKNYNFQPFTTPIFESQALFIRSVGETSDIVAKEMYRFNDRKNRALVLRPEGTSPIARAVIENKLYLPQTLPLKLFYVGPMFRYERPQAGRSRQFDQLGIEIFAPPSLYQDLEVIRLIKDCVTLFQLEPHVTLDINYLVGATKRDEYVAALREQCALIPDLCDSCHIRLEKNPLRVLDCKIDQDKFQHLPRMVHYLTATEENEWKQLQIGLEEIGLKWRVNHKLVRGLDYYTGLIFELKAIDSSSPSQNTILAGGRYNHLLQDLGGPNLAAIGFAIGLDRLFELIQTTNPKFFIALQIDFYVWAAPETPWVAVDRLITHLRRQNFRVATDFISKDVKRAYRKAEHLNAKNILLMRNRAGDSIIEWKNEHQRSSHSLAQILIKLTAKGNH